MILDLTGNVLNSHSIRFWESLGVNTVTVSVEMSLAEINALADRSHTELPVYGYLPLMITHQCPIGNFVGSKKDHMYCKAREHREIYRLRCGKEEFRLDTDCRNCLCTVTTSEPLDIGDDVNNFQTASIRLIFTEESGSETRQIIRRYEKILCSGKPPRTAVPNIYGQSVL